MDVPDAGCPKLIWRSEWYASSGISEMYISETFFCYSTLHNSWCGGFTFSKFKEWLSKINIIRYLYISYGSSGDTFQKSRCT